MSREFDAQDLAEIARRPGGVRVLTAQRQAMSKAIVDIDKIHEQGLARIEQMKADQCAMHEDKRQRLAALVAMLDAAIDGAVPGQLQA
jgi:hypothetical protein